MESGLVRHDWLAGLQWDRTHYDAAMGINFFPIGIIDYAVKGSDANYGASAPLSQFQEDRYTTLAVYVQDQMTVADRLHLLASLRATQLRYQQLRGGATNESYKKLTPRLGVTYDIAPALSAFAGYARGFRATTNFLGMQPPVPETSMSTEAGIKFSATELGLSGTVAAYRLSRENVPTADPANPFLQVQTGRQRSRGVEADLLWEPSPSLSVLGSYAYTRARVTRDNLLPVGDLLARIPENQGRVAVRYRVLSGQLAGLGLGAGFTTASRAELTLPNSGYQGDSQGVVDIQASYDWGRAKIGVAVANLFDRRYHLPYQYLALPLVVAAPPRTVQATVGYQF